MIQLPRSQQGLSAFKVSAAFITLLALPMAVRADSLILNGGRPQLVAIDSSLRQLPSVRVFLADYLVPPWRGLSFRMQWTADGQPMDPNLDRVHAECIFRGTEALSCEALRNWFGDQTTSRRAQVKSYDRQAFFIPNMEFDTEYCFRFQANDEDWSAWTCARTPPKPALPIAPQRPTLTTIAESTETRVKNSAHPFAIYVEWDAVPHEDSLTARYAVEIRNEDGRFTSGNNGDQGLDNVSSYHQTLELPGRDPDGEYVIRVCAVNVSGRSCSLPAHTPFRRAFAEIHRKYPTEAADDSPTESPTEARADNAEAALAQPPPVVLGRVRYTTPPDPTKTICDYANSAREHNSPAAPGLERQCNAYLAAHPLPTTPEPPLPPPQP